MGFYDGLTFFIALFIGCIPAVILGFAQKNREKYILFFSLVMAYLIYKEDPKGLLYLITYIFLETTIIQLYQASRKEWGKKPTIFHLAVAWAICPLALAKLSGLFGTNIFGFIGISYITFKVIQIIIETYDGVIEESKFSKTLSFLLFFPTLSSGPIDRSRRFEEDLAAIPSRADYADLLQAGLRKILLGVLYKFVLSAIFFDFLQKVTGRYAPQYLILYAYIYGFYMFFDFAGYSLMAIGTGYILGIRVPDNFNKPFISLDMIDFWNRWHISLSHWFRDFIFSRFMVTSIRKKWFKKRLNAASIGFIVNMLVMGIWHGLSFDYIFYGLYHGVLLALTERWQKTKWYKKYRKNGWYKAASWFITLNLVMFGFLIFSGYFTEAIHALGRVLACR